MRKGSGGLANVEKLCCRENLLGHLTNLPALRTRSRTQRLESLLPIEPASFHEKSHSHADLAIFVEGGLQLLFGIAQFLEICCPRQPRLNGRNQLGNIHGLYQMAQFALSSDRLTY